MTETEPLIFVVDDDDSVRKSLARLIKSVGLHVESFASGAEFLTRAPHEGPACLVLDVRMSGLSGLDLQAELTRSQRHLAIVFITGHGTIEMGVEAMKAGAVDFLVKPFSEQTLLDAISRALKKNRRIKEEQIESRTIQQRVATLTPRERDVFALVVSGMGNKQIGFKLGISENTIKIHRARVMQKMQAASLADLVRLEQKANSQ